MPLKEDWADGNVYTSAAANAVAAAVNGHDTALAGKQPLDGDLTALAALAAPATKLSGIATGATANDTDANLKNRANHTGTQSADSIVDGTTNKAYTAVEKTKLGGVATSATANSADATLLARANHTGTQLSATISDLTETAQDIVGAMLVGGTYNDAAGTYTLPAGGGAATVTNLGNLGATFTLTSGAATGVPFGVLTANTAITLPSPTAGASFTLALKQNGTGGFTPTFTGATVDYPAGTVSWLTAANALNVLEFRAWDTTAWHVFPATSSGIAVLTSDTSTAGIGFVVDEDAMTSNSATKVPTQQSVKAYVDANAGGGASVSAATVGPNWYDPSYISGQYYMCNSLATTTTSAALSFATLRLSAWVVTDSVTITRLFAEHTVLQAGTSFRIGIYNDDGSGRPGTLRLDAGTIDTSIAAAVQEITVSHAITPGLYWVGGAVQGSGTQPTMRIIGSTASGVSLFLPLGTSLPTAGAVFGGWSQSGVSGALPGTLASPALGGLSMPRIGFKVA